MQMQTRKRAPGGRREAEATTSELSLATACARFNKTPFLGRCLCYTNTSFLGQAKALVRELQKPDATAETHLMISLDYAAMFGLGMNQVCYTREGENSPVLEASTES